MAEIILGCDLNNPAKDRKTQEYMKQEFEKHGHTVEVIPVEPLNIQIWGGKSSSSGKIGVVLTNSACIMMKYSIML